MLPKEIFVNSTVEKEFKELFESGKYIEKDNPFNHFIVFGVVYNPDTKSVFMIQHKATDLLLTIGGHIEKEEDYISALKREIKEEIGFVPVTEIISGPFLVTKTECVYKDPKRKCKTHFDIWYEVESDGSNFNLNHESYEDTIWLSLDEAIKKTTDESTPVALKKLKSLKEDHH